MVTAPAQTASLEALMAETPLLGSADPRSVHELVEVGHVRHFRRNTYLFHQGDDCPDLYFLIEGRVEISSLSATGQRQLHTTIDRPQFFGELGVLGEVARTSSALALDETTAWAVPAEGFLGLVSRNPSVARAILRALARQVVAHEAFTDDLLFLDLKGRVAKRLLQLVSPSLDDLPADGAVVPSVVTHADLASLCGGSRENVTRILSDFQRRGLVERDGRRFVLRKISGLARLAGL
ncbi:MAG TPA: Crp/Fnr family transcriptional regulator [Actinomycetota bacterium]|nr:Crp/Fnr family transcriptional regulator [Actinomycetota bacterium]